MKKCVIVYCIFALSFVGCKRESFDSKEIDVDKNDLNLLSSYFKHLKIEPLEPILIGDSSSASQDILRKRKRANLIHLRDSSWISGVGKSSFYKSDEMTVTPSNSSFIYPGAILKASSIVTDQFETLFGYERAPISVELSFPSSLSIGTIPIPSLSNSRIFLRNALMAPDFSGLNIVNFSQYLSAFSKYEEVKFAFGYNVNEKRLFSSTNSSFDYNSNSSSYSTKFMASYTVKNFRYNMSNPTSSELIDVSAIPPNIFSGVSPVYVNSVTYGRFGLLVLESNNNSYNMKSVFEKVVNKILKKTSESYTQEEKSLFSNCRVTVYLLGSTMGNNLVQLLINPNPESLSDFISENVGVFTASDPGVPISYTANYLKDNSRFETTFKIDFPN